MTHQRCAAALSAGLLAGILSTTCDPQDPAGPPVLAGIVVDATGAPVEGANIGILYLFRDPPPVSPRIADVPGVGFRDSLYQNRPNPFDGVTALRFVVAASEQVRLNVMARDRRHVRQLVDAILPAGVHEVIWDRRDDTGRAVALGPYIARLEMGPTGSGVAQEIRMFHWTPDRNQLGNLATTDRNGRFSLLLGSLHVGEVVSFVAADGTTLEPQPVLSTIELCATSGSSPPACTRVDLGDLRRSVTVSLQLP